MKQFDPITAAPGPFALLAEEKRRFILPRLTELTRFHYFNCPEYRKVVDRIFGGIPEGDYQRIEDVPYVPVHLFKKLDLRSVRSAEVFKVLTSSGTSGSAVSRINLDRATADLQARALVRICQHFLGKERLPMVVLDSPSVLKNRESFSARGAGILGLMQFGHKPIYGLREDMTFDLEGVKTYLAANASRRPLFFGFTFMVWRHAIAELKRVGVSLSANNGILIHGGGWKKMEAEKVHAADFGTAAKSVLGVREVRNFYGMVEQVGSVFFENDCGYLHAPVFADVVVRDPGTLRPLPIGERGVIQVLSLLPQSYPGHALLTEDMGRLIGVDDSRAGMHGAFFSVDGRAPRTEVRGCSDTYEAVAN